MEKNTATNRCGFKLHSCHLAAYKALGTSLNFSGPWIPHLEKFGVKNTCLYNYRKGWNLVSKACDSVTNKR